jgi:hypothetical protein
VVFETWEKPVTRVIRVGVTSTVDGADTRAELTEQATQTARWDGRAKAVRTPIGGRALKGGPPSGERAGAEASAVAKAQDAAVRALAARVASEVLLQVDWADPQEHPPAPSP